MKADESIEFHAADIHFVPTHPAALKMWLAKVVLHEKFGLNSLNFIFCSDEFLLEMNRKHLNHDFYTDVITFDLSNDDNQVEGEVYISVDRLKENAHHMHVPFEEECHRVMVHGILHLCGYDDKDTESKSEMTEKEDYYLSLRDFP